MYKSIILSTLAAVAMAKTDLEGCTSSSTVAFGGASMVYWDPTNGEICSFLDCGGGRAPPKTTVPGCPQYSGTASYTPDYLPGWVAAGATSSASATASASAETSAVETSYGFGASGTYSSGSEGTTSTVTASTYGPSETLTTYMLSNLPTVTGTGGASPSGNVTVPTVSSPSQPAGTGAASAIGVTGGLVGLMAGVVGLAVL